MCGIVGIVGKSNCQSLIMQGLERLEYRGYDSAGFACINKDNDLSAVRSIGHLKQLRDKLAEYNDGTIGIGHTRWATHGEISESNTHPQFDCMRSVAVVHNGIIENHHALKKKLIEQNHRFHSATDTEVIPHLVESLSAEDPLEVAVTVAQQLEGAYACLIMSERWPNTLIALRRSSPLCIAQGDDRFFVASDALACAGFASSVLFMPDFSIALITDTTCLIYDFSGKPLDAAFVPLDLQWTTDGRCGYEHFMLKEIFEQKTALQATVSHYKSKQHLLLSDLGLSAERVESLRSLHLIGCGTSWHAARIAQFFFERVAQIPTRVMLASEFRYISFFPENNSMYMGISQSGETLDTLECLRLIKKHNLPTIGLTNIASSTLALEADGILLTKAGREISVASTKAFSTQLAALFITAHVIAKVKGLITEEKLAQAYDDVLIVAEVLENSIERYRFTIQNSLAPYYASFKRFIFLGRHISYPFAMEAALKLKEVAYIFAQCYPAGELKHGPIALLDDETPVVLFSTLDEIIYQKILSNAQQVKARNAHIIVFAFEGQEELIELADCAFILPRVNPLLAPLAMTGLMQFWVYNIAKTLGRAIDKPRNLAKSVTVE